MSDEFKPIMSQEELDGILKGRLARAEESYSKRYADYDDIKAKLTELESTNAKVSKSLEEAMQKVAGFEKDLAEKDSKIQGYESQSVKQRIAHEVGLPFEMANRLSGTTEEDIRKDAEELYKLIGSSKAPAPLASVERKTDANSQAYKSLLTDLFEK